MWGNCPSVSPQGGKIFVKYDYSNFDQENIFDFRQYSKHKTNLCYFRIKISIHLIIFDRDSCAISSHKTITLVIWDAAYTILNVTLHLKPSTRWVRGGGSVLLVMVGYQKRSFKQYAFRMMKNSVNYSLSLTYILLQFKCSCHEFFFSFYRKLIVEFYTY